MLLLVLARLGVLVPEDEVDLSDRSALFTFQLTMRERSHLVGSSTLVGTEHDDIWSSIGELLSVKLLVILEKLHVGTTADQRVLPGALVSNGLQLMEVGIAYSAA